MRTTRVLAVQAVYTLLITGDNASKVVHDYMLYAQRDLKIELDGAYFSRLATEAYSNCEEISRKIEKFLAEGWSFARLGKLVQAILLVAAYELEYSKQTPPAIIINEYIEIAKFLNHPGEAGFINSVLDKLQK